MSVWLNGLEKSRRNEVAEIGDYWTNRRMPSMPTYQIDLFVYSTGNINLDL